MNIRDIPGMVAGISGMNTAPECKNEVSGSRTTPAVARARSPTRRRTSTMHVEAPGRRPLAARGILIRSRGEAT